MSLARGDYAFSEFEFKYHSNQAFVRDHYCRRCRGTGNWSEKKRSSRRCPECSGDGRTAMSRMMTQLSNQATLSCTDLEWWLAQLPWAADVTAMLLDGRLHAIGDDRYIFGSWLATIYSDYFRPVWVEAAPETMPHRDMNMIAELTTYCGASLEEARLILSYLRSRVRATQTEGTVTVPPHGKGRRDRGIVVDMQDGAATRE